ncbi:MAG: YfcE family phosphodiesterase [Clostridia bacterium]|nr:YfcE family phosphodiesterase [Clostridia bacterium]
MELLVLSDSHGRRERLLEVMSAHWNVRAVLFLGDGLREAISVADELGLPLEAVRGNCDMFGSADGFRYQEEQILSFGAYTILMMHGHTRSVKSGIEQAVARAVQVKADVLLYGHTHLREERYLPAGTYVGEIILPRPLWIMNPGSVGRPSGASPSYGVITIQGKDLLLSFGRLS